VGLEDAAAMTSWVEHTKDNREAVEKAWERVEAKRGEGDE